MLDGEAVYPQEPPPPQRLGETVEFRSLLFRLLELQGWKIDQFSAVGGGVIVIAHREGAVVQMHGPDQAEIAAAVFVAASRLQRGTG